MICWRKFPAGPTTRKIAAIPFRMTTSPLWCSTFALPRNGKRSQNDKCSHAIVSDSGARENLSAALACRLSAGLIHLYQLYRPRQSLHCGAAHPGRSRPLRVSARHSVLFLLLDLCHVPNRFRLAGGPLLRELDFGGGSFAVVRGHVWHRFG